MNIETKRAVNWTGVALISTILLQSVFILLISGYLVVTYIGKSSSGVVEKEVVTYQSFEYFPETEEFSFGIVTQFEEIGSESLFSIDERGKHLLLSKIGREEYICTGRCSCENGRRTATKVHPLHLVFLVASLSSILAYNRAGDYFKSECENQLTQEGCPKHFVQSTTENCEGVHERLLDEEDEDDEFLSRKRYPKFICWGRCIFNEDMLYEVDLSYVGMDRQSFMKDRKEFCNNMRLETSVLSLYGKPSTVEGAELEEAKDIFQHRELDPFCRKEGEVDPHKMKKYFPELGPRDGERWSWCQGSGVHPYEGDDDLQVIHPKVECRRVR